MNIWVVKLSPSGGMLGLSIPRMEKELSGRPKRFRAAIDRKEMQKIKEESSAEYCKDHRIIGIGWSIRPESKKRHYSFTKYMKLIKKSEWWGDRSERSEKILQGILMDFHNITKGDVCWCRDADDYYYACRVTGRWRYVDNPINWARDIVQIHKCGEWKKAGTVTEIPSEIARKLIMHGRTVCKIDTNKDEIDKISKLVVNSRNRELGIIHDYLKNFKGGKVENYLTEKSLEENLTAYDYEDLVGIYLQEKYYIVPSTRTPSTKDYEFVLLNRKDGSKAAVQAKWDKELRVEDFENELKSFKYIFLASWAGVIGNESGRIKIIKRSELLEFFKKHLLLLPDRIKFKAAYLKS
jgi:hypothetical protein